MNAITVVLYMTSAVWLSAQAAERASTQDYYITNGPYAKMTGRDEYGFKISLQDIYNVSFQNDDGSPATAIPSEMMMNSLTLYTRTTGATGYKTNFKVALCLWSSDGSAGTLLSVSENAQVSAGAKQPMTFAFASDLILDTSQTYQVFFVYDTTTAENWDYGKSVVNNGVGLTLVQTSSGSSAAYKDNKFSMENYMPLFSIHMREIYDHVPEPAAYALSFMSATGYALRRRRR